MFLPLKLTESEEQLLVSTEDYEDKVHRCVQALVILGQEKAPIKKSDLNRLVSNLHYRTMAALVLQANKQLNKIFGMRLFELADRARYLLVNSEIEFSQFLEDDRNIQTELTVLYFILMGIFVSADEKMAVEEIDKAVRIPMGFSFEALKEYLDLFVKRLYLKLERQQDTRLYSWGDRAIAEVEPEIFFQRFLELTEDTSCKAWPDLRKRLACLSKSRNK